MINRLAASSSPFIHNDMISEFIDYMHDYSDHSVKQYSYLVKRFLKETKLLPNELNKKNILEYCRKYYVGYIYLNHLKLFGEFLYEKGLIDEKTFLGIKLTRMKKKEPKHIPVILSKDQWGIFYRKFSGPLKMAVFLQLNFGLRIGEICNITIQDIDLKNNLLSVSPNNGWKPKSKSSIRELPITISQRAILAQYVNLRIKKTLSHNYLLYTISNGNKLQEGNVMRLYRKYLGIWSHDLRKSAGTYLFNTSMERETVKDFLGHKDPRTTELYLKVKKEETINRIREAQKKANL